MRFKKDDRVVTTATIGVDEDVPIGSVGTITTVYEIDYKVLFDCYPNWSFYADDRCLEKVGNVSTITSETKSESFEKIQPEIDDRQQQCLKGLQKLGRATANELAMHLFNEGITPFFSRNFVHPRLTELVEQKKVKVVGKKLDSITDRTCAIYEVINN